MFTLRHMKPYAARLVAYGFFVVLSVLFTMATALSVADFVKLLFSPADGSDGVGAFAAVTTSDANLLSQALKLLYDWLISFGQTKALVYFSLVVFGLYAFKNLFG